MTDNGLPSWTAPSGRTYPPPPRSFTPPILPTTFTTYNAWQDEDEEDPDAAVNYGGPPEDDAAPEHGRFPQEPDAAADPSDQEVPNDAIPWPLALQEPEDPEAELCPPFEDPIDEMEWPALPQEPDETLIPPEASSWPDLPQHPDAEPPWLN